MNGFTERCKIEERFIIFKKTSIIDQNNDLTIENLEQFKIQ